ncbi:MAG: hypothetical protein ACOCSM_01035, partial [Bacillota bacterium]
MKKETLKMVPDILFFAALWGIVEATLGYALHWIPGPLIAGSILFPFAMLILVQAYKRLESRKALLAIGALAALIKSVNLLMPNLNQFKVINPMIAIVMETAVITVVAVAFVSNRKPVMIGAVVGASIGWRGLYLGWRAYQLIATGFASFHLQSVSSALEFTLLEGIISAAFAIGLYYGFEALQKRT